MFREDSFDSVTRVRRGRIYTGGHLGDHWYPGRVDHGPYQSGGRNPGGPGQNWQPDASYNAWTGDAVNGRELEGQIVTIGSHDLVTSWRVIGVELTAIGHVLFTLRASSLFGVVPELLNTATNQVGEPTKLASAKEALDSLVDVFLRQQPTPTIDAAREAARVILSAWIGPMAYGKDLKDVIKLLPAHKGLATWAALIVNRLHPRGKSAEVEAKASDRFQLRALDDDDASVSVQLVGLLLREIGWAAS